MSRLGPIVTLAAGAVLAAGLGVASITAAPAAEQAVATADEATRSPETGEETAAAEPSPSETPTFEEPEPLVPEKADYAGRVKDNGGLIAISIRDGKAVGYFCDGKTEAWFKGNATSGRLTLKGSGKATVKAELGDGGAEGQVAVGGRKWSFVAGTAKKPSGLYRASAVVRGAQVRAGWIVVRNPSGGYTQVGAASQDGEPVDIPRLDGDDPTSPVSVNGATVTPEDVDGFIEEMS
ncbi:hypothetical protein [Nonomuraea harbinensis]|uniref:Serine/threonine protein kinase n=1 Tax=Nonomuraea harbinensis TaxID=1286938 RepID=A0ABW1BV70_9ACTN|nr:hypothetical protein [Nonomuraea harbinensis]